MFFIFFWHAKGITIGSFSRSSILPFSIHWTKIRLIFVVVAIDGTLQLLLLLLLLLCITIASQHLQKSGVLVWLNNYAKYHPVGISNRFPFPLHMYEQHDILPPCSVYSTIFSTTVLFIWWHFSLFVWNSHGHRSKSSTDRVRKKII